MYRKRQETARKARVPWTHGREKLGLLAKEDNRWVMQGTAMSDKKLGNLVKQYSTWVRKKRVVSGSTDRCKESRLRAENKTTT